MFFLLMLAIPSNFVELGCYEAVVVLLWPMNEVVGVVHQADHDVIDSS